METENGGLWDNLGSAASETWQSVTETASGAWNGATTGSEASGPQTAGGGESALYGGGSGWDSLMGGVNEVVDRVGATASEAWGSVQGVVDSGGAAASNIWGSMFGDAPAQPMIEVPMAPAKEGEYEKRMAEEEAWRAAGGKSPYEQQMAKEEQNVRDWKARDAGFPNQRSQEQYRDGKASYDKALDDYLAKKGPSPGPQNEYIEKHNSRLSPNEPTVIPERLRKPAGT